MHCPVPRWKDTLSKDKLQFAKAFWKGKVHNNKLIFWRANISLDLMLVPFQISKRYFKESKLRTEPKLPEPHTGNYLPQSLLQLRRMNESSLPRKPSKLLSKISCPN